VGEVIAQVIAVLEDPPQRGATRVTLVREESGGSLSFAESFYRRLRFNGKSALENANAYQEVTIAASRSAADVEAAADRIAAGAPTFLAVQGDPKWTVPLLTRVESKVRLGARKPTYLLGLTSPKPFKDFLGRMADRRRRFLSVDTIPNEPNNARFVIRYNQEHATPVTRTFNPGMTYDATYALAYATFALGSEPVTGPSLAGAFGRLLAPGRPIDVGPSDVFDAVTTLAGGGAIDLRGTESGLDFDLATGEDPFDFTVYCPAVDADGAATGEEVSSGVVFRTSSRKVEGALRCP
jgi:hypothetical protein